MTKHTPPRAQWLVINRVFPGIDVSSPHELFGPDTLTNLAGRIVESERHPHNRELAVSDAEVARVLALYDSWPDPVRRRLGEMAECIVARPRGRAGARTIQTLLDLAALAYYERAKMRLEALKKGGRLRPWCAKINKPGFPVSPAQIACWLTRRLYFPNLGSDRSVANKLMKMRR